MAYSSLILSLVYAHLTLMSVCYAQFFDAKNSSSIHSPTPSLSTYGIHNSSLSVEPFITMSANMTSTHHVMSPAMHSSEFRPNGSTTEPLQTSVDPDITSSYLLPTTSVHPTTTQAPTKAPAKVVDYKVRDNQTVCIDLRAEISFTVTYQVKNSKKTETATFSLGANGFPSGDCAAGNVTQARMEIKFDAYDFEWFFHVDKNNKWTTTNMTLNVNTTANKAFHNADKSMIFAKAEKAANVDLIKAGEGKSYKCDTSQDIQLSNNVVVKIAQIQVQPFTLVNGNFSAADTCPKKKDTSKKTNNIVPIAVGCALAGLIVIVLIAYLIGRRKTNRGYQPV